MNGETVEQIYHSLRSCDGLLRKGVSVAREAGEDELADELAIIGDAIDGIANRFEPTARAHRENLKEDRRRDRAGLAPIHKKR